MADDSSRRAIQNAFSLIFDLKLPSEIAIYAAYMFATKLKDAGRGLPKVHLIVRNRLYMGAASAYAAVLQAVQTDVKGF